MSHDLTNATIAVTILQWMLELAAVHPVKFSVLFAVMSIAGIIGAASILVEPLYIVHTYFEERDKAAAIKSSRSRKKKPTQPPPSKLRRYLHLAVVVLSAIARNPPCR